MHLHSVCEIGMLNFPFLMGSTHSELLLADQLSLSGTDLPLESSDDLFAYIAYLLVHQECKVPGSQALMPAQSVQPLSLQQVRVDE